MGWLSNRVTRESLKPGDHIYTWRTAYFYAHHGIYVGDDKVIHFTRSGQEEGTGSMLDRFLGSSVPYRSLGSCPTCTEPQADGVVSSCLDCFLAGGALCRYEYGVSTALFLADVRGGTCTLVASDRDDIVVHRATYLLNHGVGCYDVLQNNCENFAVYCKTGKVVVERATIGQSGQAASLMLGPLAVQLCSHRLIRNTVCGTVATGIVAYYGQRYATDIGVRSNVVKVEVEELTTKLQVFTPEIPENVAPPESPQHVSH